MINVSTTMLIFIFTLCRPCTVIIRPVCDYLTTATPRGKVKCADPRRGFTCVQFVWPRTEVSPCVQRRLSKMPMQKYLRPKLERSSRHVLGLRRE